MVKNESVERHSRVRFGLGEAWALGSAGSYALTNIFSRIAVVAADPLVAPIFRSLPTLAIGWTQVVRSRRGWSRLRPSSAAFIGWRVVLILLLGGTAGTAIGTVAFFFALQAGGVVLTAPVLATNILWSAIIAALFLSEPLTMKMTAGILVAVAGVGLLGYGRSAAGQVLPGALLAIPLALLTAIGWASAANCTRYALTHGADKYLAVAVSHTWGIVLLIAIVLVSGRGALLWTTELSTVGLFILAGALSALALYAGAQALSLTTVSSVSTIEATNPVLSTILAVLFLGEELNVLMAIGTVMTIVGVAAIQLSKPQPEAVAEPDLLEPQPEQQRATHF